MDERPVNKWKRISAGFCRVKSVGELIENIPQELIERIAFILLMVWTLTPVIALFFGFVPRLLFEPYKVTKSVQMNVITIGWYSGLQMVGYSGCLLGVIGFTKSIRNSRKEIISFKGYLKERLIPLSLFLMLIWSIVSFFVSANGIYELTGNLNDILHGGFFRRDGIFTYIAIAGIFSCSYIVRSKELIRRIIWNNTIMALIQALLILVNVKSINRFFGLTKNSGVFFNINHAGYYLCMATMCVVYLFVSENKSKFKLLVNLLVFIMFFVTTFLISLLDGELLSALRLFGFELRKMAEGDVDLAMGSGRLKIWKMGLDFTMERPLFGYGPAGLSFEYKKILGEHNRPHNKFLEHAATIGIPGLLFYVTTLVSSLLGVTMFHTWAFFFMFLGLSVGQLQETNHSSCKSWENS